MTSLLSKILQAISCIALLCLSVVVFPTLGAEPVLTQRESRGVWLDKSELLEDRAPLKARIDRMADAGINTIYAATQIRGTVVYPNSQYLPQYAPAQSLPPDHLTWFIDTAHARGLRVEAWTEFGFYAYWTKDASTDTSRGAVLDRHPDLAAIDASGSAVIHHPEYGDFYSLCPANPNAQHELIALHLEMLERFPFDGLQLDRVRFPDARFCYCQYCREHFQHDVGMALAEAAGANAPNAARQALDRWRKQQVCAFVERMSTTMRRQFPQRSLTSAVVPPSMIDEKGQDWPVWVERGWVDAVAVMLYAKHIEESLAWIRKRLPLDAPVYIGLDAAPGIERLTTQIETARSELFPGIAIWYSRTVDPMLPRLHETVFSEPAVSPLGTAGGRHSRP